MTIRPIVLAALLAVVTTSCATQELWRATDPDAFVSVPESQASEAQLREQGRSFLRDEDGGFRVAKTRTQRVGDHTLRALLTPATVCLDALPCLTLLGTQAALGYLSGNSAGQTMTWAFPSRCINGQPWKRTDPLL